MLKKASEQPGLDVALRPLMKAAGIKHGDVAGVMFSGPNGESWPTTTPTQRLEMLDEWICAEHSLSDEPSSDDDADSQDEVRLGVIQRSRRHPAQRAPFDRH